MKVTTDINAKYSVCIAPNAADNSPIKAGQALAGILTPFGMVGDLYVVPPSAGDPTTGGVRYKLPEMQADGVPTTMPLALMLDFTIPGKPVNPMNVGLSIQFFRANPTNGARALSEITGLDANTVLAQFTRLYAPSIEGNLTAACANVVAVEEI